LSNRKALPLLLLLLVLSIFVGPLKIPLVNGALTGQVCITDATAAATASSSSSNGNPCPGSPYLFDGPVGQEIRIGVYVNGSDPMNVFGITLLANHTFLKPIGVDLTGSVLNVNGPALIVGECLSGVLIVGGACAATDTIDTLDLDVSAPTGQFTGPDVSGLLFTAIYDISANTTGSPVSVGYQTGCITTSVSAPGNVCVTIYDGSTKDTETVQGASFDNSNSATMMSVSLSATPTSFGPELPGSNTATVTATAENGYPSSAVGSAIDLVNFTTTASSGLTATMVTNTCMTSGVSCSVSLGLSTTSAGDYAVTVLGTYETLDPSGNSDTLIASVSLTLTVYDFAISVSPTSISFSSGSTGTATVTLSGLNGFAGTVTLSTGTVLPAGLTITYNPASVSFTGSGTQTSTATLSASPATATTYHATIKATSGSRTKTSSTIVVSVTTSPDFTIAANPSSVSTNVGVAGSSTVTITALHGFTGTVILTNRTSAPSLSCSLSPASIPTSGSSTLSCTGSASGSYTANVTGTSGSLAHFVLVSFTVTVPSPDFALTTSPTAATVEAGVAATSTVNVTATNGFVGTVNLSDSISPTTGLACSLSQTSIILTSSAPFGTSTLSCTGSAGAYAVTVTGSNSTSHSHSSVFSVTVRDFSLAGAPTSLTVNATASGTSTISVTPVQGFSGAVSLTLVVHPASGLACSLSPPTISGGSGSSTLSCSGSYGSYLVNVTGTSGPLSHFVTIAFTVQDFAISASPLSISFGTGSSGNSNITITPLLSFSETVSLSAHASDPSLTVHFSSNTVTGGSGISTMTVSGSTAGNFNVNVTGVSGPLAHSVVITVTVVPVPDFSVTASPSTVNANLGSFANSSITVAALNGFTGTITLTNSSSEPALVCSLAPKVVTLGTSGSSTLSCKGPVGVYTVTVTGTNGTLARQAIVNVNIQDFTMSSSPTSLTINAGIRGTSTITVTALAEFTGTVMLSISASTGLTATLSATTVSGQGSVLLTVNATIAGDYNVNVTCTSGSLTHTTEVIVTILDFSMTPSVSPIGPIFVNETGNSTITVTGENGFTGTVTLGVVCPDGTCNLNSTSITGSGAVLLKFTGSTATDYLVNVTGTSGNLSHSLIINVVVVDISPTLSKDSVTINEGSSEVIQLSVSSLNGFAGQVSLGFIPILEHQISVLPSVSFASPSLILTANGQANTAVNVTVVHNVPAPGLYLINVTATAGPRTVIASLFVDVPTPTFAIRGVQPPILGPGGTGSSLVTLTSEGGLYGNVTLSVTSPKTGFLCTLSRTTVYLEISGANTTLLSCAGSAGNYNVTITGVGTTPYPATITENGYVGFVVADFSVSSTPTGILIDTGQSGHASIKISWNNNFNGTVSLSALPSSGLNASLSTLSIRGATGSTTLNVVSNTAGTYSVVVNATSGSMYHTVTITVTVSSVAGAGTVFGLSPATFYSIVGLVVVAAAGAIILLSRRAKLAKKKRRSNT
jgi:hypothetical protein